MYNNKSALDLFSENKFNEFMKKYNDSYGVRINVNLYKKILSKKYEKKVENFVSEITSKFNNDDSCYNCVNWDLYKKVLLARNPYVEKNDTTCNFKKIDEISFNHLPKLKFKKFSTIEKLFLGLKSFFY